MLVGVKASFWSCSTGKRLKGSYLVGFIFQVAQSDFLCEECVSGYRAESYCEECIMNLCESCSKQHRRRRATTNHTLVKLRGPKGAEVPNIHRAQYCAIHRTSRYELYCESCERLICNECARHDHQQCSYKLPSASLIEKHRQRVKDIIESLCHKLLDDQALQKLLSQSIESSDARSPLLSQGILLFFFGSQASESERGFCFVLFWPDLVVARSFVFALRVVKPCIKKPSPSEASEASIPSPPPKKPTRTSQKKSNDYS